MLADVDRSYYPIVQAIVTVVGRQLWLRVCSYRCESLVWQKSTCHSTVWCVVDTRFLAAIYYLTPGANQRSERRLPYGFFQGLALLVLFKICSRLLKRHSLTYSRQFVALQRVGGHCKDLLTCASSKKHSPNSSFCHKDLFPRKH